MKRLDITQMIGKVYGYLTVLGEGGYHTTTGGNKHRKLLCQCKCGNQVAITATKVNTGYTKSCGCFMVETSRKTMTTHGLSKTSEHKIWCMMKARCYNPSNKDYYNYGQRGILMDEKWRNSFEAFYSDMGPKPKGKYSIDRIDNSKGYFKENCRWATDKEQARNHTNNRLITYNGETKCLAEWAELYNMKYNYLKFLLNNDVPFEVAITRVPKEQKKKVINNSTGIIFETVVLAALSENIPSSTLANKLRGVRTNNTSFTYFEG